MMASAFKKNQQKSNSRKSQTLINSPVVKRMHNRPVALQGWLLKRGSDGLMLWKKRWFVLSDYCLFYYKDTLEEKLLGSLILASYEISPCSPDEKGYKKFSFKAEHANMRTYYFAAENQALMEQWIKALTLASLLEENISCENIGEQSRASHHQSKQGSDFRPSSQNDMMNNPRSDLQPLYANAPPKPKRLNESSSPECPSDIQYREDNFQNYQNQPYHVVYGSAHQAQAFSMAPTRQTFNVNYEQRPHDTYVRSNIPQQHAKSISQKNFQERYTSPLDIPKDNSHSSKNVSFSFPPRPHSVDFLDYNAKSSSNIMDPDCPDKRNLNCRPKSSLSTVNTNEGEAIHWSAEEYARKMRQSSMYVKPTAKHNISGNTSSSSQTSNSNVDRQIFKNDLGITNERAHAVHYRSRNMTTGHEKHFSRSASARLFRPMSDGKEDCDSPNTCNTIPLNAQPENMTTNKDSSSKVQQREESMKRLLEWKQRMLQSPLTRKPHGSNMLTSERLSSYTMQNKTDSYQSGSISSCGSRIENTSESVVSAKELTLGIERPLNSSSNEVLNEADRNHAGMSSPAVTFYHFSSDDDGLDGCDPKYGNPVPILENSNSHKEGRRNHVDKNSKMSNESNMSEKSETLDTLKNIRIPDGYDYSDEKTYSNLKSDYGVGNKVELNTNVNCNYEDENNKNKFLNSAISLQDFNKKVEKKSAQSPPLENERDEEWGIKLDESRVIKEFSYHYITSEKYDECQSKNDFDNFMHTNFKNKMKHTSQDIISNQSNRVNAKKNSSLQNKNEFKIFSCNELSKHNDTKSIKKESNVFQKVNTKNQRKCSKGNIINKGHSLRIYRKDNNKTLPKDIINKSIPINETMEKRLVQSDSEALLYDTSSDVEDKIVFHHDHFKKIETSSDDERDEEVAAVLSKEKNFASTAFQSVNSPYRNCPSRENVDHKVLANDGPSIEMKVQSNNEQNSCFQISHEKNLSTSTDMNSDNQEENYMPMTPRKKSHSTSKSDNNHSRSNSASHTLIIENLLGSSEESPYVEMTQNRPQDICSVMRNSYHQNSSSLKSDSSYNLHFEAARYCEIDKGKEMQYEMIYNAPTLQEPLYMEVPSLKEKDDKELLTLVNDNENIGFNKSNNSKENISQLKHSSRPSLPDILNTTTPSLNQGSCRSDSSDADDEASKDLDSLDAPRHPRFSLSDTFRPASYYLGASLGDRAIIALNTEHPDSSDSDLVSPPPIPTSSPPLDELETSIDSTIIDKESVLSHLKTEQSNIYSNELFLHSNVKDFIPPYKIKNTLRNSNSNLYEASSEESVNCEKREQRLKRRPLSADILSSLQDISFIMPPSDLELKENTHSEHQAKSSNFVEDQNSIESDHLLNLKLYKYTNSKSNNFYSVNSEDIVSSETLNNDSGSEIRYNDNRFDQQEPIYGTSNTTIPEKSDTKGCSRNQYENLRADSESEFKLYNEKFKMKMTGETYKDKSIFLNENKPMFSHPAEHQNNAPYYYSDLLKIETKNFHEFDKNRWDEHISDDNDKVSTLSPNEKNFLKTPNYNQFNEFDSPKIKPLLNESYNRSSGSPVDCKCEAINKITKKAKSDHTEYAKYSNKNESHPSNKNTKNIFSPPQESCAPQVPHRTRSLEGLIDSHPRGTVTTTSDIFPKKSSISLTKSSSQKVLQESKNVIETEGSSKNNYPDNQDIWEEDTLWRESLRKVSIRHTRSLEDLDRKEGSQLALSPSPKMSDDTNKTYENLNVVYKNNERYSKENHDPTSGKVLLTKYDSKYQTDKIPPNIKVHELNKNHEQEISQMDTDQRTADPTRPREPTGGTNSSFEIDREKLRQWDLMSSAPAMLSSNKAVIKPITERKTNFSSTNLPVGEVQKEEVNDPQKEIEKLPPSNKNTGLIVSHEQDQGQPWNLKVSAGELLGRTHEELVLLLIQLRRQRATVCQSMEKCHREIEAKACLADLDKANRLEHLQKLDELKAKLADLEKQYEKGKPLVNLVDNMVKLGSLYQAGSPQKLEFIQRIQEQRLLAEERRDWERIRPDHHELKAKVERLYRLDKLLQEESGTLHSLQQDKGVLERALGGLRNKLQGIHGNSPETEWYKRQQRLLERELSRVRSILALNSKKLEETVAENARLEQELVVLRQKLQLSRRAAEPGGANTAALEAELCRVQLLVGNLLRQRQELSLQVRQLTEKSNSLSRQIWPNSPDHQAEGYSCGRKQLTNGWIETDLDADVSNEISNLSSPCHNTRHQPVYISPLYVNTTDRESVNDCCNYQDEIFDGSPLSARSPECRLQESNEEEAFKQAYGLHLKEKPQEIKTVRIVKRESERRQRDRDRSGNIGIPITYASPKRPISDDRLSDKYKSGDLEDVIELEHKPNEPPPTPGPRTDSVNAVWNMVRKNKMKGKLICKSPLDKSDSLPMQTDSPQLSPVYLSETARKIVEEVAWQGMGEKRLVPKEKRRHHTMSGPSLIAPQNLFSQMGSRDDLDIERVLRPRLTTPDVVRSTLIRVDPHYTKETIDNILGAPGKILIPERYIPESQPELTKEEQNKRSKKADAIRKMLCETTAVAPKDSDSEGLEKTSSLKRKVAEEKKNREHLLQLSQILAQQVMEKSKIVAGGNPTALE